MTELQQKAIDKIDKERVYYHPISEENKKDIFYTIPIHIPKPNDDQSFLEWENAFKKYIKEGRDLVKQIETDEKPKEDK